MRQWKKEFPKSGKPSRCNFFSSPKNIERSI